MRRILFTILALSSFLAVGQNRYINKANFKYENLAFADAAALYERGLAEYFYPEAAYKLANSLKFNQQYVKAEFWYAQNLSYISDDPEFGKHYAEVLQILGKYNDALVWFKNYKKANPFDKSVDESIAACRDAQALLDMPAIYELRPINVNSAYSDFGAIMFMDKMYFISNRLSDEADKDPWTGHDYLNVYSSSKTEDPLSFETIAIVDKEDGNKFHEGPLAISPNGFNLASTWNYTEKELRASGSKQQKLKLMLYTWNEINSTFEKPVDFPFNSVEYNIAHPAFSLDGKRIYFASDMDGGYGGTDIWYSDISMEGEWGNPINCGKEVNSPKDEAFPTVGTEGNLYFSSTGFIGYGGLDLFVVDVTDKGRKFENRSNMGQSINSSADDFSVFFTEFSKGYIASNRQGGVGEDDLYYFEATKAIVDLITLYAKDSLPAAGVNITILDENEDVVGSGVTDNEGKLTYALVVDQKYTLNFETPIAEFDPQEFDTDGMIAGKTYEKIFYLDKTIDNGFMGRGLIVSQQSKLPLEGAKITMLKDGDTNPIELTSDRLGFYSDTLESNTKYIISASLDGYETAKLVYVSGEITADFFLPVIYLDGGDPTYNLTFENIYFDYDKATLREDSRTELEQMLNIMRYSPALRVEISAHTDSRGSDTYNLNLSDRRAASVRLYLIENGIDPSRMTFKGYGETKLTNDCENGVKCSEAEHQKNRRVEFAVLNKNNEKVIESKPKKDM